MPLTRLRSGIMHWPMTTIFLLFWVVVVLFTVSRAPDALWRRVTAHPRDLRGSRLRVAIVSGLACWVGLFLFFGWLVVRVPGPLTPDTLDSQPVPPELWQAAAFLFSVGLITLVAAVAGAPQQTHDEPSDVSPVRILILIIVGADIPLVIASLVSTNSSLRALPIVLAVILTCVCPVVLRRQWR